MIVKCVSEKHKEDMWFKNVTEIWKGNNMWKLYLTDNRHRFIHKDYEVKQVLPNDHYRSDSIDFYEK